MVGERRQHTVPVLTKAGQQIVERLLVADLLQTEDVNVVVERGRDDAVALGPKWLANSPMENRFSTFQLATVTMPALRKTDHATGCHPEAARSRRVWSAEAISSQLGGLRES